jgi:hypothetical protein
MQFVGDTQRKTISNTNTNFNGKKQMLVVILCNAYTRANIQRPTPKCEDIGHTKMHLVIPAHGLVAIS